MKRCSKCHIEKNETEFCRNRSCKGGRQYTCKSCMKMYQSAFRRSRDSEEAHAYRRTYYSNNKSRIKSYIRAWKQKIRSDILSAYGGKCACCGETEPAFLHIDHINGDGSKHRKERGGNYRVYQDIRNEGYPNNKYQILCANCNLAKAHIGYCPHHPPHTPHLFNI